MRGTPQRLGVTFIGHSSFLVQAAGQNLLYGSPSDRRSIRIMHRQCPQMESKTGGEDPVTPQDASSDVVRLVLFASVVIAAATPITLLALGAGARSSFTAFDIPDLQGLTDEKLGNKARRGFDVLCYVTTDLDAVGPHATTHLDDRWSTYRLRLRNDCCQCSEVCSVEPAADPKLCADTA